jgi:NAD(P)-dependent dehydrogenase (short-subunit alcohol dehydrogenase family)
MPKLLPTERTAVITGGASPRGIGRATADRLADEGWSVAILDIDGVAAKLAAAEVADKYSVSTLGVGADISDENSVQAAIAQVESTLPPIIGLANVVGVSSPSLTTTLPVHRRCTTYRWSPCSRTPSTRPVLPNPVPPASC